MLTRRKLFVAATLAAVVSRLDAAELKRWKGKPAAPPIELLTPEGAPFSLKQLRGKVVLVNFWATWCEPCITEMPSLQRLRNELAASGFEVLAVNYQEGPARINGFIQKMNLTLPVVRDTDGSVARSWGARVFPGELSRRSRRRHPLCSQWRCRLDKPEDGEHNPLVARTAAIALAESQHIVGACRHALSETNMKRRTLLQAVPAAGLLAITPFTARSSGGSWRTFEVVTRVEVAAPTGQVMVWVPLPLSQDTDWFQTLENSVTGNFTVNNDVIEPNYRAAIGAATFKPSEAQPVFEVTSRFRTRDRKVEFKPGAGMLASAAEQADLPEADRVHADRRHRARHRAEGHQGRAHRCRQGARDLRLDSREHRAQSEDARAAASATSRRCSKAIT